MKLALNYCCIIHIVSACTPTAKIMENEITVTTTITTKQSKITNSFSSPAPISNKTPTTISGQSVSSLSPMATSSFPITISGIFPRIFTGFSSTFLPTVTPTTASSTTTTTTNNVISPTTSKTIMVQRCQPLPPLPVRREDINSRGITQVAGTIANSSSVSLSLNCVGHSPNSAIILTFYGPNGDDLGSSFSIGQISAVLSCTTASQWAVGNATNIVELECISS